MTAQDRAERRSGWMTAEAIAALCGVSVATVKRRAEDGKPIKCRDGTLVEIESERVARPQGWEWRVRAMTAPPTLKVPLERSDQENSPALTSGAQSDQRALDILETLLRANGETFERQAEQIASWREQAARSDERAIAADRRADRAEREHADAQAALRSTQEALAAQSVRADQAEAERDALAASLARRAGRRWRWWPWRT